TGTTPALFVLEVRLEEAARRLRTSRLSVKEIAAATGFRSSNQLCKSFRRYFQMSPGSFRKVNAIS
ncbi:MAG: helix-turn-helix domain-containing protein, partial [Puniceicoccales bacterium]